MPAFFLDYNLMPFHLSLLAIILFGVVKTIGFYFGLRPSKFLQKISPYDFQQMDLLNVKFSKTLIVFFFLMNFSFAGYVLQFLIYSQEFKFLPAYYLIIPALIIATFFTIFMIHCLDQVIPPKYKKNKIREEVKRASHTHQVPHIGLPQIAPVASERKLNTAPIGAIAIIERCACLICHTKPITPAIAIDT